MLLLSVSLPLIYNGKAIHSQLPCLPYGYAQSSHENYSQSLTAGWERAEGVARKLKFSCELGAVFVLNGKSEGSGKRLDSLPLYSLKSTIST